VSRLTSPDWFRVVSDLIYVGIPMKEIARTIDVQMSEALIRHYRSGGQPTYVRGEALIRMWCDKLDKTAQDLPRVPWYPPNRLRRNRGLRA
jgi:hypothetical protein